MTEIEEAAGQTTVLLAGVVAVAILLAAGVVTIAGAMVHRQRAQTAADAVALAAAMEPSAADELVEWYGERSISVAQGAGGASASSGPSTAQAWASTSTDFSDADLRQMALPALVAIVARAEQLTGGLLTSAQVIGERIELDTDDASALRLVAAELGLCEHIRGGASTPTTFGLC